MVELRCPGCGVGEACFHEEGCVLRPVGVRPCCNTPIWPDVAPEHADWCEWGSNPQPNLPYWMLDSRVWD